MKLNERVFHPDHGNGTIVCVGTTFEAHADIIGTHAFQTDFEFDCLDVIDVKFDNGHHERFTGSDIGWIAAETFHV